MAKKFKRTLAFSLVVCMLFAALPMQSLAADVEYSTETSPEGILTDVSTSTDTIVDADGNTTVVVTIQKNTNGDYVDSEGNVITLDRQETINKEGDSADSAEISSEGGTETKEWTQDVAPGAVIPEVEAEQKYQLNEDGTLKLDEAGKPIPVTDNNNNIIISGSANNSHTGTTGTTSAENPDNYDSTTTTTITDRTVTGTVSQGEIISSETKYETVVGPEDFGTKYDDTKYADHKKDAQADGVGEGQIFVKPNQANPNPDGNHDFFLSGLGEWTDAASPVFKHIVYQRDENGNPIPDLNNPGEYLIDEEKSQLINGEHEAKATGMDYQASQLILTYENGEYFYAYCADYLVETSQEPGYRYRLENLEDSGHYDEADAQKLRAIVTNGYWGNEEGKGSLESMKALLAGYAAENPTVTITDERGNPHTYDLAKIMDGLQPEEALAVTQAAIWAYSINRRESLEGVDKVVVVGAKTAIKCFNDDGGHYDEYRPANNQLANLMGAMDKSQADLEAMGFTAEVLAAREAAACEGDARMQALFDCLMALEGIPNTNEDVSQVINENTIEDVSLVIQDKVSDGETVNESNETVETDVYNAELNFKLAFIPGENDEVYVYLLGSDNQVMVDADGKPVKKLLAKENPNGDADVIVPVDGVYTLTGLQLAENVEFDLRLEGTQYLNEGVYLYSPLGERTDSQTLVGMASGSQKVEVGVTISFDVDEKQQVVATREWHAEVENEDTHEDPVDPDGIVPRWNPPENNRLANDEGEVIEEEEVPLAAPVSTGDNTGLWIAFFVMIAFGIVAINLFDKKRQSNAF